MTTDYILISNDSFITKNSISHHGIKGMKWGIRRNQTKDSTMTFAGIKQAKKTKKYRRNIKKTIKIGAILVGIALAAYGSYKLSTYVKSKKNSSKIARKLLEESIFQQKSKPLIETTKSAVKPVANDFTKRIVIPRAEVSRSIASRTNAYERNNFESLRKANADLLNKTLDDLLKGL